MKRIEKVLGTVSLFIYDRAGVRFNGYNDNKNI